MLTPRRSAVTGATLDLELHRRRTCTATSISGDGSEVRQNVPIPVCPRDGGAPPPQCDRRQRAVRWWSHGRASLHRADRSPPWHERSPDPRLRHWTRDNRWRSDWPDHSIGKASINRVAMSRHEPARRPVVRAGGCTPGSSCTKYPMSRAMRPLRESRKSKMESEHQAGRLVRPTDPRLKVAASRRAKRLVIRRIPRFEVSPTKAPPNESVAGYTFDLRRLPAQDD